MTKSDMKNIAVAPFEGIGGEVFANFIIMELMNNGLNIVTYSGSASENIDILISGSVNPIYRWTSRTPTKKSKLRL